MPVTVVPLTVVAFVDPAPPEQEAFRLSNWLARIPCLALMYAFVEAISVL